MRPAQKTCLGGLAILVICTATSASPPSSLPSGSYQGSLEWSGEEWDVTFQIESAGATFRGTLMIDASTWGEIKEGMVSGDTLSFLISGEPARPCTLMLHSDSLYVGQCCDSGGNSCPIQLELDSHSTAAAAETLDVDE